jgi:hypothetical protein
MPSYSSPILGVRLPQLSLDLNFLAVRRLEHDFGLAVELILAGHGLRHRGGQDDLELVAGLHVIVMEDVASVSGAGPAHLSIVPLLILYYSSIVPLVLS